MIVHLSKVMSMYLFIYFFYFDIKFKLKILVKRIKGWLHIKQSTFWCHIGNFQGLKVNLIQYEFKYDWNIWKGLISWIYNFNWKIG